MFYTYQQSTTVGAFTNFDEGLGNFVIIEADSPQAAQKRMVELWKDSFQDYPELLPRWPEAWAFAPLVYPSPSIHGLPILEYLKSVSEFYRPVVFVHFADGTVEEHNY